jgi:hypothetical protein
MKQKGRQLRHLAESAESNGLSSITSRARELSWEVSAEASFVSAKPAALRDATKEKSCGINLYKQVEDVGDELKSLRIT